MNNELTNQPATTQFGFQGITVTRAANGTCSYRLFVNGAWKTFNAKTAAAAERGITSQLNNVFLGIDR